MADSQEDVAAAAPDARCWRLGRFSSRFLRGAGLATENENASAVPLTGIISGGSPGCICNLFVVNELQALPRCAGIVATLSRVLLHRA